jgi:hypothetical protein
VMLWRGVAASAGSTLRRQLVPASAKPPHRDYSNDSSSSNSPIGAKQQPIKLIETSCSTAQTYTTARNVQRQHAYSLQDRHCMVPQETVLKLHEPHIPSEMVTGPTCNYSLSHHM